jgi:hypothetical protein
LVLNQDLQDFEDFLALEISLVGARCSQLFESGFTGFRGFLRVGVVWSFESGFTGFTGFFSVRCCL